jgi:hypothetical protein
MRRWEPPIRVVCMTVAFIVVMCSITYMASAQGDESPSRRGEVAGPNDLAGKGQDENLGAASLFEKADRLYVEQPGEISNEELLEAISRWPSELTERQRSVLGQWVAQNREALAQLRLGTQKVDYLTPFQEESLVLDQRQMYGRGREKIAKLMRVAIFRVRFAAAREGVTNEVEEDLLMCHRVSLGLTQSSFLLENLSGMWGLDRTAQAAFDILARMPVDRTSIQRLQGCVGQYIPASGDRLPDFVWRERLLHHASVARLFDGTNPASKLKPDDAIVLAVRFDLTSDQMDALDLRYARTTQDIDAAYAYCSRFLSMSPWQAKAEGLDFYEDLAGLTHENPLVTMLLFNASGVARLRAHYAAKQDALVATLALMRYRQEKAEFPGSLQELVSAGYLSRLPTDPYSDNSLVYRRTDADFMLYSVAEDFDDDGGWHSDWGRGEDGGDYVFWPVQARITAGSDRE